jgi:phosphoribosyl-dephospho-CoA transferase
MKDKAEKLVEALNRVEYGLPRGHVFQCDTFNGDGRTLSRRESRDVARHIAAHEPFTLKIGAL